MDDRRLIIGCGNLLRGDDGLGPRLVRRLWELGVGDCVRLSDGGTSGMNVAFDMRGMRDVVIVDACRTGAPAGTVFEVPGDEVETPPLEAVNLHNFRWDHAIAFGKWLLKGDYPERVSVILVEAQSFEPGAELTPPVADALEKVARTLAARYGGNDETARGIEVELTDAGYLVVDADTASRHFATGSVIVDATREELVVTPLHVAAVGGFLLKQRNARGDRSVLVKERLEQQGVPVRSGRYRARWDSERGALRMPYAWRIDGGRDADVRGMPAGASQPMTVAHVG
ncbi:MAG: hydrogenase maturation protease [Phycisphaerae bacterium]|nr:hydrogenase maturation protease [Phycisphaerae bacterium]